MIDKNSNLRHVRLILTERCNLNCNYCYLRNKGIRDMDFDTAKKSIELLFKSAGEYKEIYFFGGEPLLRFNLIKDLVNLSEKLKLEHAKTVAYEVNTNGILLTKEMLDFFRIHDFRMAFSIDGKEDTFVKIRGTKEEYLKLISNLSMALKFNKNQVRVRMTITPSKAKDLFSNFKYLYEIGVKRFAIGPAQGIFWPEEKIKEYSNEINKITSLFVDKIRKNEFFYIGFILEYLDSLIREDKERSLCYLGEGINVEVDGNFTACSYCSQLSKNPKLKKLMSIGDIKKGIDAKKRNFFLDYLLCKEYDLKCKKCTPVLCNHICFVYSPDGEKYPLKTMRNHYMARKVMYLAVKKMYKNLLLKKDYDTIKKMLAILKNMNVKKFNKT